MQLCGVLGAAGWGLGADAAGWGLGADAAGWGFRSRCSCVGF